MPNWEWLCQRPREHAWKVVDATISIRKSESKRFFESPKVGDEGLVWRVGFETRLKSGRDPSIPDSALLNEAIPRILSPWWSRVYWFALNKSRVPNNHQSLLRSMLHLGATRVEQTRYITSNEHGNHESRNWETSMLCKFCGKGLDKAKQSMNMQLTMASGRWGWNHR